MLCLNKSHVLPLRRYLRVELGQILRQRLLGNKLGQQRQQSIRTEDNWIADKRVYRGTVSMTDRVLSLLQIRIARQNLSSGAGAQPWCYWNTEKLPMDAGRFKQRIRLLQLHSQLRRLTCGQPVHLSHESDYLRETRHWLLGDDQIRLKILFSGRNGSRIHRVISLSHLLVS